MTTLLLFVSTDDYEPEFGIDSYQGSYNNIVAATKRLNKIELFDSAQLLETSEDVLYLYASFEIRYEDESEMQRVRVEGWKMNDGEFRISRQIKQVYIPPARQVTFPLVDGCFGMSTIVAPQGHWENAK